MCHAVRQESYRAKQIEPAIRNRDMNWVDQIRGIRMLGTISVGVRVNGGRGNRVRTWPEIGDGKSAF